MIAQPQRFIGKYLLTDLSWPRASFHSFWWKPENESMTESFWGADEDYLLVGRLFDVELHDGVEVTDWRHDPPLYYDYQRDMTAQPWEAILAENRDRQAEHEAEDRARDELVGKPALPFPDTTWLNSEPLTWERLRGQIVILDFWAEWCGPCRYDLPRASELHKQRESNGLTIIGVHTPGSERAAIEKIMKLYGMEYPICIDLPATPGVQAFGHLSGSYGVRGIPYAFVVDANGRVAGHGSLDEVLNIASGLPRNAPGDDR